MTTTRLAARGTRPASFSSVVGVESESRHESNARLSIRLDPEWLAVRLGAVALLLVVLHIWIHVMHHLIVRVSYLVRGLLDLDAEQSVGTWYAAFLLCACSVASFACSRGCPTGVTVERGWRLLGCGFLILSVDEVAGFHESFNSVTEFSWAIPGVALLLLVGACSVPFLRQLPRETSSLLLLAGTIYGSGALGVELATEPMAAARRLDTLSYSLTTALEEGLEMAGVVVFILAAHRHLARAQTAPARFHLGT